MLPKTEKKKKMILKKEKAERRAWRVFLFVCGVLQKGFDLSDNRNQEFDSPSKGKTSLDLP